MTYVQWWCSGVMLGRNVTWPFPLLRQQKAGPLPQNVAPQPDYVQPTARQASGPQSPGATFDQSC
jgi:hypothetical protein